MCTIEGCDGKAVSKGLCAKHNMRLRRTGDPNMTRKPGVAASDWSKWISSTFSESSPRTRARYKLAMALLADQPKDVQQEAIRAATRANGSVNVSRFADIAATIYVESHDGTA
jgi:hypothetical protein